MDWNFFRSMAYITGTFPVLRAVLCPLLACNRDILPRLPTLRMPKALAPPRLTIDILDSRFTIGISWQPGKRDT